MKKYALFLIGFILFFLLPTPKGNSASAFTPMTPGQIKEWRQCNDTGDRLLMKNEIGSSQTSFKNFLNDIGVTYERSGSIRMANGSYATKTFSVQKPFLTRDCVIVYGSPDSLSGTYWGGRQDTCYNQYYFKGGSSVKQYRYYGFYYDGGNWRPYPNPYFCDFGGHEFDYILSKKFIKEPWKGTAYSEIKAQNAAGGSIAIPSSQGNLGGKYRLSALRTAIDRWYLVDYPNGETIGHFNNKNTKLNVTFVQGNLSNSADWTGAKTPLTFYADVHYLPQEWVAGSFSLYHKGKTAYWMSTYFMPPEKDPFCSGCSSTPDLEVVDFSFTPNYTPSAQSGGTEITNLKVKVKNNSSKAFTEGSYFDFKFEGYTCYRVWVDFPNDIASSGGVQWSNAISKAHPDCNTSRAKTVFAYPSVKESLKYLNFTGVINPTKAFPAGESNWNNNKKTISVPVKGFQNAKVKIDKRKTSFNSGKPIDMAFTVTNGMFKPIDSQCGGSGKATCADSTNTKAVYSIKDLQTGTYVVQNKVYTYSNLPVGGRIDLKVGEKLKFGYYSIEIKIPRYSSETNPPGYTDNVDTFEFNVKPVFPANTTCKFLDVPGTVIAKGTKDIAKMCVGSVPNYPSTDVEGGQGSYFLVEYVFLPMPIPTYKVETHDKYGAEQTLTLLEENDEPGVENNFLYFPTKKGQVNGHNGPFIAGPHSYYHYLYRGRMFAKNVKFNFNVKGPKGETVAIGHIDYDIPPNCYDSKYLDYKDYIPNVDPVTQMSDERCRRIYFFLPNSQTDLNKLAEEPLDSDKLYFKNPGIHSFEFTAQEDQYYRYQYDEGTEAQGKSGVKMPSGYTAVYEHAKNDWQETIPGGEKIYKIQNQFNNHCYAEKDSYGKDAFDGQVCFHNHGKDFHKWIYRYSDPKWMNDDFSIALPPGGIAPPPGGGGGAVQPPIGGGGGGGTLPGIPVPGGGGSKY